MIFDDINNLFANCEFRGEKIVIKTSLHEVIKFVKEKYHYNFLKEIIAVDCIDSVELIYHLYSIEDGEDLLISIFVKENAETITDLFKSAQADENEIFDLFGINFIGNENLKRLYMPESWQGHPLKKDYIQNDERLNWNEET